MQAHVAVAGLVELLCCVRVVFLVSGFRFARVAINFINCIHWIKVNNFPVLWPSYQPSSDILKPSYWPIFDKNNRTIDVSATVIVNLCYSLSDTGRAIEIITNNLNNNNLLLNFFFFVLTFRFPIMIMTNDYQCCSTPRALHPG